MSLIPFWYIVIAILWTGFFILEGFDFGVGMLLPLVGRTATDRRVAINTIGPVWDGVFRRRIGHFDIPAATGMPARPARPTATGTGAR